MWDLHLNVAWWWVGFFIVDELIHFTPPAIILYIALCVSVCLFNWDVLNLIKKIIFSVFGHRLWVNVIYHNVNLKSLYPLFLSLFRIHSRIHKNGFEPWAWGVRDDNCSGKFHSEIFYWWGINGWTKMESNSNFVYRFCSQIVCTYTLKPHVHRPYTNGVKSIYNWYKNSIKHTQFHEFDLKLYLYTQYFFGCTHSKAYTQCWLCMAFCFKYTFDCFIFFLCLHNSFSGIILSMNYLVKI